VNESDFDEILSQPLTTEDGFLNPACLNELEGAISALAPTHVRLKDDPEWSEKKDRWTFRTEIVGHFAMWACRQSPYGTPDGLENVCKYLFASLKSCTDWGTHDMAEVSLCEINRWLREILYDQGVSEFDAWNRCKVVDTPNLAFASAMDGPSDPDRDFIDLDALLHNVCVSIRDERRKNKDFNDRFEAEYGSSPQPDKH
jgi:hypothetical protein